MAVGSTILDSNGHPLEHRGRNLKRDEPRPVTIEEDVWISLCAVVLPGSHVGRGSVIGANAVVSGSVPPTQSFDQVSPSRSCSTVLETIPTLLTTVNYRINLFDARLSERASKASATNGIM